jgi:hypothetical protein
MSETGRLGGTKAGSTPQAPPVDSEAVHRIAKLELEQKQLGLQVSWRGQTIEWLKAAAPGLNLCRAAAGKFGCRRIVKERL